ncbi:MAG: hypothetical protein J6P75_03945 [Bacteroidales bacterium]|nr:hypothetical protein [Bacteroidales bacterium]
MENNRTEILRELEAELAALKEKVLQFENKLEAFRQLPAEEPVEESDFTDMEIGVSDLPEPVAKSEPVAEPVAEPVPVPDLVEGPEPEPVPEPEPAPKPATAPRPETERLPWRLDKPGISVKHIRSGISMYDRALFIGTLFKEDYALYDRTIGELDALTSLDEAVDYLLERFPDWNLKSDIVYNFMMAIRKKLG